MRLYQILKVNPIGTDQLWHECNARLLNRPPHLWELLRALLGYRSRPASLVSCQDPLFWRCVWISESPKSTLNRRAKPTPKEDKPQNAVDLHDFANSAKEIGLPSETVALLETDLEISDPAPRKKAKASPKRIGCRRS